MRCHSRIVGEGRRAERAVARCMRDWLALDIAMPMKNSGRHIWNELEYHAVLGSGPTAQRLRESLSAALTGETEPLPLAGIYSVRHGNEPALIV